jgi:predicted PurR-regulated permease PerM
MALFAMVPMVGAGAVWLPAALLLLILGQTSKAVILVLVGALLIGTIDNFLRPRLVGGRTGLHELVVFFAVLGGLRFFGIVGLLIGPAVVAVAWSLLELFRLRSEGDAASPAGGSQDGATAAVTE